MNKFTYSYPTKIYFGEGAAADALKQELPKVGKTVLLAYGGGSVKKSGVYDELKNLLAQAGKEVMERPYRGEQRFLCHPRPGLYRNGYTYTGALRRIRCPEPRHGNVSGQLRCGQCFR